MQRVGVNLLKFHFFSRPLSLLLLLHRLLPQVIHKRVPLRPHVLTFSGGRKNIAGTTLRRQPRSAGHALANAVSDAVEELRSSRIVNQDPMGRVAEILVLDGTHIDASVPGQNQSRWRNRKGDIAQNVLAACDFSMDFVYVMAGWEGSAHDSRVLADARSKGFAAPPGGYYYLADAGYSNSALTLVPYQKTRYHLREQARAAQKPQNEKELFNLRHSSLRNVIERTFGVLKNRFAILQKPPRMYNIRTQIQLVFALTAVHNFMNSHGHDPEAESNGLDNQESEESEV